MGALLIFKGKGIVFLWSPNTSTISFFLKIKKKKNLLRHSYLNIYIKLTK